MKRVELLGCPLDVATMTETLDVISSAVENRQFTQHTVVNVAKLVHMRSDPQLNEAVISCDIINIDGMGVVWGARWLGIDVPQRIAGIDLFWQLLQVSEQRQFPIFLLGAEDEIVKSVAEIIGKHHPQLRIAGYHHGYFWSDEQTVVDQIRHSGARLLFVAITSPHKECFINRWRQSLGVDFVMGVGGTFDVIAGKVKRAPKWMQNSGLEWLYRLLQEPRRMWKRYLVTNSIFLWLLLCSKFNN